MSDVPFIVDLAIESVSQNPLPVKQDPEGMRSTVIQCLGPAHFCWVAEQDGKVVASVVAMSSPGFWFHRLQLSVLLYYTRVPGGCIGLLRELARWVKSRPAIKIAVMEMEPETDPRLVKFMSRVGFSRQSTNVSYVRGV